MAAGGHSDRSIRLNPLPRFALAVAVTGVVATDFVATEGFGKSVPEAVLA